MSDFIPNTFQTPNAIVDKLMFLLTDSEFRVLMYMVRHILGWQRKADSRRACISLSNFSEGFSYPTPDGEVSYPGCGLNINPIRNALKELQKYRIVEAIGTPKAIGQEWELRFMTKDDVDFIGLQLRQDKKHRSRKKQTEKAREVSPKNVGVSVQQIEHGGICSTDRETISQTDTEGICSTDNNETHSKYHSKDQEDSLRDARALSNPDDELQSDSVDATEQEIPVAEAGSQPDSGSQKINIVQEAEKHLSKIASESPKPKMPKNKAKPKMPRERNRLWDGVCLMSFKLDPKSESEAVKLAIKEVDGLIGKICKFLRSANATPENLWDFYKWYQQKYPGAEIPCDYKRFVKHYGTFIGGDPSKNLSERPSHRIVTAAEEPEISEEDRAAALKHLLEFKAGTPAITEKAGHP